MSPAEVWHVIAANTPEKTYGSLKRSEVNEMIAFRDKLESQGYELA